MKLGRISQNPLPVFVFLCAMLVVSPDLHPLLAQTPATTGTLRGQVTDPSGSAVQNAAIVLATPSGSVITATTNRDGIYEIKNLAPGKYSVKVIAEGFAEFDGENLQITAGQVLKFNASLTIQTQEQKVVVTDQAGAAIDVNPASNAGAIVIQGKDLDALSDDPDELQSDLQALAGPSAGPNGGQIYIDGFTAGQLPSKASIREIRINQNPFSSEYDKLGYGRIEILTKPGTDQWHGQLAVSGNSSDFNSRNPFERLAPGEQPPGYESILSWGNIGGPLSKNASFFFNYEQRNINNLNVVSAQYVDPTTFQITPFSQTIPNPSNRIEIGPRVDFQLTPSNVLTVRYQLYRQTQNNESVGGLDLDSLATNAYDSENTVQISDTQTLSTRTVNETRFQYIHEVANGSPLSTAPMISVPGAFASGGNSTGTNDDVQNRYELQNITYVNFGTHSLKYGGRLRSTIDDNFTNATFNGQYSFGARSLPGCTPSAQQTCAITPLEAYQITLQGLAQGETMAQIQGLGGGPSFYALNNNAAGALRASVNYLDGALFLQDDWRVKPNITFSYGLRYETQNNLGDHADFAPRLGLAWGIGSHGKNASPKFVVRLGSGIFYDRFTEDLVLQQEEQNGLLQQQYLVQNPLFFNLNQTILPSAFQGSAVSPQTVFRNNPNLRTPYIIQSGVSLERQITKSANIAVTYLDSRGEHQFYTNFINANQPGVLPPNPIEYEFQSEGVFRQRQLIVNSSIRMGARLTLFGYYVLNYANSDTAGPTYVPSDPLDPALDYGRAAFDYRNRLFMGGSVGLPKGFRFSPFLIASSGIPFNITTGQDVFSDAQFNVRPAFASCTSAAAPGIVQTQLGCFNVNPAPGSPLVPMNYLTGAPRFALNFRLSKTFGFGREKETAPRGPGGPMGGTFGRPTRGGGHGPGGWDTGSNRRYTLTLSASVRNAFNNVNYAIPIGNLSSPLFGNANGLAAGPYSWGNTANRHIDFQAIFSF